MLTTSIFMKNDTNLFVRYPLESQNMNFFQNWKIQQNAKRAIEKVKNTRLEQGLRLKDETRWQKERNKVWNG